MKMCAKPIFLLNLEGKLDTECVPCFWPFKRLWKSPKENTMHSTGLKSLKSQSKHTFESLKVPKHQRDYRCTLSTLWEFLEFALFSNSSWCCHLLMTIVRSVTSWLLWGVILIVFFHQMLKSCVTQISFLTLFRNIEWCFKLLCVICSCSLKTGSIPQDWKKVKGPHAVELY